MDRPGRAAVRLRRSPHLVTYWRGGKLLVRNYATGDSARVSPLVIDLLDFCGTWRSMDEIRSTFGAWPSRTLPRLIQRLVAGCFLEHSDRPRPPQAEAMALLDSWNPEAGFFHTATKDVRFWSLREARRRARKQADRSPAPASTKRYRGAPAIALPPPPVEDEFPRIVLARRTWRRYSAEPVTLPELSTLLGLSAGVQQWVRVEGRDVPLKTSPSGGARHPIECYVVARAVRDLPPALYHYASDRHRLERIRGAVPPDRIRAYVPQSAYFARASAMVFFTAVFNRQVWRYPYARAYRAALIEAGHHCQTFCLAATWLGLAPFSVMGLADSVIERDLGIDGISESVLYAAGVGRPPRGSAWAPLPRGTLHARPNRPLAGPRRG